MRGRRQKTTNGDKAGQRIACRAKNMTYTLVALCTSAGILATSFAAPALAHAATPAGITDYRSGPLAVNQQLWRNVPYFVANRTTFFGIWYLQQLFKSYGYTSKWDGHSLLLPQMPVVSPAASTSLNGKTLIGAAGTMTYQGTTYVDAAQVLQALGGSAKLDATTETLTLTVTPLATGTQKAATLSAGAPTLADGGMESTSSTKVQSEARSLSGQTSAVWEGTQLWRTTPTLVYQQSTYFGVWYLQQFFRDHGIVSTWNGTKLSIASFPRLLSQGKVQFGSATISTALVQWQGTTFIPISMLQSLGVQATVNQSTHNVSLTTSLMGLTLNGILDNGAGLPTSGAVAIQDGNGVLHVLAAASNGAFSGNVVTDAATVIGVRTNEAGWVGQVIGESAAHNAPIRVNDQQMMTTVQGQIGFNAKTYPVVQVSLRNIITHAHYYANVQANGSFTATVPVGAYEVFAVTTDEDAIFILQHFMAAGPRAQVKVTLPALPTSGSVQTQHASIQSADSNVTPEQLLSVAQLFEYVYSSTSGQMGTQIPSAIQIHLFGSTKTYQQHYLDEGYSATEAKQIAELSVASEEGLHTINVLMPTFNTVDGLNILAHELTHALIAQKSTAIPSWANEGAAWTEGVNAETDGSPSHMLQQGIQWNEWVDIVAHQKAGTLTALGQGNSLNASYNVEAQDYFAVQQLVAQFGWEKFLKYVAMIDKDSTAFQDTFGETFAAFSKTVTAVLQKDAAQPDSAMYVRVRTLPNGPKQVYFINPSGQRFLVSGVEQGQTYDFVCNTDGTVTAPVGLTVTSVTADSVAISGDWYLGSGGDGTHNRQEFDLVNQFGLPFVDQVLLYTAQGNIEHVYPATAIPNGLELVKLSN